MQNWTQTITTKMNMFKKNTKDIFNGYVYVETYHDF